MNDPALAVAERAARNAAAVIADAARDLKRLATFSKERGELVLVHEAGGRVGDSAGTANFLKSGEVLAAAPGVFSALREVIAGALG